MLLWRYLFSLGFTEYSILYPMIAECSLSGALDNAALRYSLKLSSLGCYVPIPILYPSAFSSKSRYLTIFVTKILLDLICNRGCFTYVMFNGKFFVSPCSDTNLSMGRVLDVLHCNINRVQEQNHLSYIPNFNNFF